MMNQFRRINKTVRGTAIFMALLMIAIVAAIAVTLLRTQQIDIRRTQMMITSEQGYLYTQGVVGWAISALQSDLRTPAASSAWPMILPPTSIADGQGKISGILQDAEGLFNINNFTKITNNNVINPSSNPNQAAGNVSTNIQVNTAMTTKKNTGINAASTSNSQTTFINLLNVLHIQLSQQQQLNLIAAITDWISTQIPGTQNTASNFEAIYARMNPAYKAPHQPMMSISELRTVAGVTPAVYNQLLPYIVALPENTNINAAHSPLLLQQALGLQANTPPSTSTQQIPSKFFLLRTDVFLQDQHIVLYSLLLRSTDPKNPIVNILWQSLGTE